jgi:hypothetical protein
MADRNKTIRFHGQEVQNVFVRYMQKGLDKLDITSLIEFDARKDPEVCQTINLQVVSDFVTITFYIDEKTNAILRLELIPTHCIERIEIIDLKTE